MASMYNDGIRYYRNGQYEESLECFLKESGMEGNDVFKLDIAYFIGLCYAKLLRYEDALLYLEQVVTSDIQPRRVNQCRLILAVIYITTGRLRLADFELHKLMESGFKSVQMLCALGYISYSQDRTEEAVMYYEEALDLNENNGTALNSLGYILCSEGKELPRALRMCKQALDSDPENPAYLDSLGWVYYMLGMEKESLQYLLRAATAKPDDELIAEHVQAARKIN